MVTLLRKQTFVSMNNDKRFYNIKRMKEEHRIINRGEYEKVSQCLINVQYFVFIFKWIR